MLLWLFSKIGTTDRRFVEFGVEDGRECNTANLSLNWGWSGLLMEADTPSVGAARRFYAEALARDAARVTIAQAMVSPANINGLLKEHGFDETFDLLSIDIDGNDYWVWEAIEASPRVVVMEYNPTLGPERAVTIPYTEGVEYSEYFRGGVYHGASLAALAKLGERKGYALVGCESTGANACFVREDAAGSLRRLSAAEAWRPSVTRARLGSIDEQQALIADLPMQEV